VAVLPEFDEPPVVEHVLDVQFKSIPDLHGLKLAPLRTIWRDLPQLKEQPPLPPVIEGTEGSPRIQLLTEPPAPRYWFLNEDGSELVQLQSNRLAVNWRSVRGTRYPRYPVMRERFERRLNQLVQFLTDEGLPDLEIIQAEISYVNAVDVDADLQGRPGHLLRGWAGLPDHHLGEPTEARLNLSFNIPELGQPPVRLYVAINPARREADGAALLFLNLTIRGNPGSTNVDGALVFIDGGREHIVRSFDELTTKVLHDRWGKRV
jgi:uncharacterized protein (TIGR04255 family)